MPFGLEAILSLSCVGPAVDDRIRERTAAWSASSAVWRFPPRLPSCCSARIPMAYPCGASDGGWRASFIAVRGCSCPLCLPAEVLVDEHAPPPLRCAATRPLFHPGRKGCCVRVENWLRADADIRAPDAADPLPAFPAMCLGCTGSSGEGILSHFARRAVSLSPKTASAPTSVFDLRDTTPRLMPDHALVIDGKALRPVRRARCLFKLPAHAPSGPIRPFMAAARN